MTSSRRWNDADRETIHHREGAERGPKRERGRVRGCARWVWRGYLGTVTVGFFSDGQTLFCTRPKVYLRNSSVSTFIY